MKPSGFCVVFVAASNRSEAKRLALGAVRGRRAACVSVLGPVRSHYRWKGRLCEDDEFVLMIKTRRSGVKALTAWIAARHSYQTPEIIALPIIAGHKPYLDWISGNLRRAR